MPVRSATYRHVKGLRIVHASMLGRGKRGGPRRLASKCDVWLWAQTVCCTQAADLAATGAPASGACVRLTAYDCAWLCVTTCDCLFVAVCVTAFECALLPLNEVLPAWPRAPLPCAARAEAEASTPAADVRPEALSNASAIAVRLGKADLAVALAETAVASRFHFPDAHYNLNVALRCAGRHDEAIARSWAALDRAARDHAGEPKAALLATASAAPLPLASSSLPPVFVCVKWGRKYGAVYVNRLYAGVRKWAPPHSPFVCLTDDPAGLVDGALSGPLPADPRFTAWWTKALLFSQTACDTISELCGFHPDRLVFLDLDTVICGSLECLLTFSGHFALLSTADFKNEQRAVGFNSSVMLWRCGSPVCDAVLGALLRHCPYVFKFVHRFDHWLEMVLPAAEVEFVQTLAPGRVVEFAGACSEDRGLPPTASIVVFPLWCVPHAGHAEGGKRVF